MATTSVNLTDWEPRFARFLGDARDAAHDSAHIRRVVAWAKRLAAAEGADLAVVVPAAWLHDCVLVPKDSPDRPRASVLAAQRAGAFLRAEGYPEPLIAPIQHAIEAHSFSAAIAAQTLEARVVQDADRLDALGAIGIARCLMLGGAMGKPLAHPVEPAPLTRPADDRAYVLDHFHQKLFTLSATMTTPSGRAEAARRTGFMRDYLARLEEELSAE